MGVDMPLNKTQTNAKDRKPKLDVISKKPKDPFGEPLPQKYTILIQK